jgi:hypothetical protein
MTGGAGRERAHGQPDVSAGASATQNSGWRALRPELLIVVIMVISTAIAAYGYAGFAAAFGTLTAWAIVILILFRALVQVTPAKSASDDEDRQLHSQGSYIGFWRRRGVLVDASINMRSYDADLRPTLQHLLAARLAERHGVSLYADPEAARRLLLAGEPDDALWYWLDPERPAEQRSTRQGIPQRTLTAIIERLERL